MSKKQPHVPETREPKPNREQRRHPEKLEASDESPTRQLQDNLVEAGSADELSVRAKTTGHGKKTADKWNQ